MKLIDFRAAHHWLRGYSDALRGLTPHPQDEDYAAEYGRGWKVGAKAYAGGAE